MSIPVLCTSQARQSTCNIRHAIGLERVWVEGIPLMSCSLSLMCKCGGHLGRITSKPELIPLIAGEFYPNGNAACSELAEASSPSNEEDEVIARICELTHRLGYNQAKTKMLLGQWARYLVSLERSLLSELEDLHDGIPNSLAASSRHEKPSSTEGFLSLDDKLIRRYE